MNKLIRRAGFYLAATVLGACAFTAILILQVLDWKIPAAVVLTATLVMAFLFGKAMKDIVTARLVIENQILQIQPAVFQEQTGEETSLLPGESIKVFVSCFGILLDAKIIKFNQQGIRLKAVELGSGFISLTYGTDQKTACVKLLHTETSDDVLAEITRKLRYETGIIATLVP